MLLHDVCNQYYFYTFVTCTDDEDDGDDDIMLEARNGDAAEA